MLQILSGINKYNVCSFFFIKNNSYNKDNKELNPKKILVLTRESIK